MSLTRHYANLSNGQGSHPSIGIDIFLMDLRADTAGYSNYSGWSYLYCAWAEARHLTCGGWSTVIHCKIIDTCKNLIYTRPEYIIGIWHFNQFGIMVLTCPKIL